MCCDDYEYTIIITPDPGLDITLYTNWDDKVCPNDPKYNCPTCPTTTNYQCKSDSGGVGATETCRHTFPSSKPTLRTSPPYFLIHKNSGSGGCNIIVTSCPFGKCQPKPTTTSTTTTSTTTTTRITTSVPCIDSDSGSNYKVKGTCTDPTGSYTDYCSDVFLTEYYCSAQGCQKSNINCAHQFFPDLSNYRCNDGKCVLLPCKTLGESCRSGLDVCCSGMICTPSGNFGKCSKITTPPRRFPPTVYFGTTEALNNPFVIVVSIIVILIIILAIFGSLKLMNKHRR
jgi:hypothetical protein